MGRQDWKKPCKNLDFHIKRGRFCRSLLSRIKHMSAKQITNRNERVHTGSQETELKPARVHEMGLFTEQLGSASAASAPPGEMFSRSLLRKAGKPALISLIKIHGGDTSGTRCMGKIPLSGTGNTQGNNWQGQSCRWAKSGCVF